MKKSQEFDSKFVGFFLVAVFGEDTLRQSSAGGNLSNFNGVSHAALNDVKLKFIKGMFGYVGKKE